MTDRIRPTPVRIVQGDQILVDGTPVDTGGRTLYIVPLGGSAADAQRRADAQRDREQRRVSLRDRIAAFVSTHVQTFFQGHTTPGEVDPYGDDGLSGRIELERAIAQFAEGGAMGDEMRDLGMLSGTRDDLRTAFDAVRNNGKGKRNGRRNGGRSARPVDLLDHEVVDGIRHVYGDRNLRDNLGGTSPAEMASWTAEQILVQDAAVEDYS